MGEYHNSVLLKKVVEFLKIAPGEKYIDATLGGGGHTIAILELKGKVLGIDVDQDALDFVENDVKKQISEKLLKNLTLVKGNFRNIDEIARANDFNNISGVLYDLGVSSHQLDTPDRGFSFKFDSQLDMRMDQELQVKALDLLKVLKRGELYELFTKYGEESDALRIAANIVESRRVKPIERTSELEAIVRKSKFKYKKGINPATKVFQALRIAVNDELIAISESLDKTVEILNENGRILVISFHSLEDRIIKQKFVDWQNKGFGKIITYKTIKPDTSEILANPRSRSAKLRVFEKKFINKN